MYGKFPDHHHQCLNPAAGGLAREHLVRFPDVIRGGAQFALTSELRGAQAASRRSVGRQTHVIGEYFKLRAQPVGDSGPATGLHQHQVPHHLHQRIHPRDRVSPAVDTGDELFELVAEPRR
jgi:hypothetical protein